MALLKNNYFEIALLFSFAKAALFESKVSIVRKSLGLSGRYIFLPRVANQSRLNERSKVTRVRE